MTLRCTQYSAVLISRYAHYIAGRNGQSLCRDKTHLLTHDDVCRVCVCVPVDLHRRRQVRVRYASVGFHFKRYV